MNQHDKNDSVIKRLKRAAGHLNKVIEMLETETDCLKVAQQLQAVSSAVKSAKRTYIQDHVEHCLATTRDPKLFGKKTKEFREITKYL